MRTSRVLRRFREKENAERVCVLSVQHARNVWYWADSSRACRALGVFLAWYECLERPTVTPFILSIRSASISQSNNQSINQSVNWFLFFWSSVFAFSWSSSFLSQQPSIDLL